MPAKMTKQDARQWWEFIDSTVRSYKARHSLWLKMLKIYDLEVGLKGYDEDEVIKVGRFYTIARHIVNSIVFNYPRIFIKADEGTIAGASEILEEVANDIIQITESKVEVRQAVFDALPCSVGWLEFDFNPPGDDGDSFVMDDGMKEDFFRVSRRNPFDVFVDPLVQPHRLGTARAIFTRSFVPYEVFMEDDRYYNKQNIKPTRPDSDQLTGFKLDLFDDDGTEFEDYDHVVEMMESGQYIQLWHIHDKLKRRLYTFCEGQTQPVENIYHPFANVEFVTETSPLTGEEKIVGLKKAPGSLMKGGFPFRPIKFDQHTLTFYPKPPLYYVKDLQRLIMESLTRRQDLLQRFPRIVLAPKRELEADPTLERSFKEARDGETIGVREPNRWKEVNWGAPPQDQIGLEADARQYESQTIRVDDSEAPASASATGRALDNVPISLNKEGMKLEVVETFHDIITAGMSMMGDKRYTPDNYLVFLGERKANAFVQLTAEMMQLKYKLTIHADSMLPLYEQTEQNSMILWFDRVYQLPETNRAEALKAFHKAFRIPNPEKMMNTSPDIDAMKSAMMENTFFMQGMMIQVQSGEKHRIHEQQHSTLENDQKFVELARENPEMASLALQIRDQHVQMHRQVAQQEIGSVKQQALSSSSQPKADGKLLAADGVSDLLSTVRGNSHDISQAVTSESADE